MGVQCLKIGDRVVVGRVEVVQEAWVGEQAFGHVRIYGSAWMCYYRYLHFETCENAWIG